MILTKLSFCVGLLTHNQYKIFNFRILVTEMIEEISNSKFPKIQRKVKIHGTCGKAIHIPIRFVNRGFNVSTKRKLHYRTVFSFLQSKWKIPECECALVWNDKFCTLTRFSFSNCANTLLPFPSRYPYVSKPSTIREFISTGPHNDSN